LQKDVIYKKIERAYIVINTEEQLIMMFYNRIAVLFFILFFSCISFSKGSGSGNLFFKSASSEDNDENKLDRMNYTQYAKMLFKAYMHQEGNDRTEIDDILKKCDKSRLYHLDRAFRYGTKTLSKGLNLHQRLLAERAIWNISQDFADENAPARWMTTVFWASISAGSFLVGSYAQRRFRTWDMVSNWMISLLTRTQRN